MADQLIQDGAVLPTELGTELVCTGVRYQETPDGVRHNYEYIFRSKADLDSEREAAEAEQRKLEEEQAALEAEATTANNENTEGVQ